MNIVNIISNKRIVLALAMIVAVAAIVISGTGAFFSDSETSANNVFTAGSIDLKVDHLKQTYNGVDCETCSVQLYSSAGTTEVVDANEVAAYQGPFPTSAVEISTPHPAWADEATVPPAQWVWIPDVVDASDTTDNTEYTFAQEFYWQGTAVDVDLDLSIAADNGYAIYLNGDLIVDELGSEFNYGATVGLDGAETTSFLNAMIPNGNNTLEIVVRNLAGSSDPAQNPAGLLYLIDITRDGEECIADTDFQKMCKLWNEKDLDEGDSFFNFNDVKPGDWGTNVISLHVYDNDAFSCVFPHGVESDDNSMTEPELDDDETPNAEGELDDVIKFVAWLDENGDGFWNEEEEEITDGPTAFSSLPMAELELQATSTEYIGLAWCAGEFEADDSEFGYSCDGSDVDNASQSDSLTAFLTAYAVQQRNNENFTCESIDPEDYTPEDDYENDVQPS